MKEDHTMRLDALEISSRGFMEDVFRRSVGAVEFPLEVPLPFGEWTDFKVGWGKSLDLGELNNIVSLMVFKTNDAAGELPAHWHPSNDEAGLVLSGNVLLRTAREPDGRRLLSLDPFRIEAGKSHQFTWTEKSTFLLAWAPPFSLNAYQFTWEAIVQQHVKKGDIE